jgi:hypothetical protein
MKDKIFAYLLTKADRVLVILWCPLGGKHLGRVEWFPSWAYRIKFVPRSWMLSVWYWAMAHGWYEDGEYKRAAAGERS